MNKKTYDGMLKEITEDFNERKNKLMIRYAMENNPYKKHDIIEGQGHRIEILKIRATISYGYNYPSCFYTGTKLTKTNNAFKSGEEGNIYQNNVKRKIELK